MTPVAHAGFVLHAWGESLWNAIKARSEALLGLLNRPQRERLPRSKAGILVVRQDKANHSDKNQGAAYFLRN